jgi:hypothetical protein
MVLLKKFFRHKKANAILDTPALLITLLALGFTSMVVYNLWQTDLLPDLNNNVNISNPQINATLTMVDSRYPSLMDGVFAFIFVGLWIAAIIGSLMIDTHPIYFIIAFLLLIGVMIFGVYASNAFQTLIADDPGLTSLTDDFPITYFVLSNMLLVSIVVGISIMIALYGKFSGGFGF